MEKIKIIAMLLVTALFCGVAAVACNCNKDDVVPEKKSVAITNKVSLLLRGDEYALTVKTENVTGGLVFGSDKTEVAEISDKGVITAKAAGSANISVSCEGESDGFLLTVTDEVEPLIDSGESGTVYIFVGGKYRPSPRVSYNGKVANNVKFVYSISESDSPVITIDETGEITALKEGECEVTVSAEYRYRKLSATFKVCVTKKTFVSFDRTLLELATYEVYGKITSAKINAVATENGVVRDLPIIWSTSDEAVASVDAEGNVFAGNIAGEAIITARLENESDLFATCRVTVEKPIVNTGLVFDTELGKPLSLPEYEIADFKAENVLSVKCDGKEIIDENGEPSCDLTVGSPEQKSLTIETQKLFYTAKSVVYNAIIREKADIDNLIDKLSRFERDNDATRYGYYYDGYVIFASDVDYAGGELTSVVNYSHIKPTRSGSVNYSVNGFNGIIDGKGHKIINADIKGGFIGHLNKGTLKNLTFENVTVKTSGSAVAVNSIGAGRVENVTVKGCIQTPGTVAKYLSLGMVCSVIKNGGARFKNVVTELTAEIVQPTANVDKTGKPVSREVASVFGRMESNYKGQPLFENCIVIGKSPVLFGEGSSEDGIGYGLYYEWDGIKVYKDFDEYYITENDYEYDAENPQNRVADCTHSGIKVYVKAGSEAYIITYPALGHQWKDSADGRSCDRCGATFSTIFAETDVRTGYDFSAIDKNKTITSVFYKSEEIELDGGVIRFEKTDVSESLRTYTVNYADGSACTVNLTLWSLFIKNEDDLRAMKDYAVQKPWDIREDCENASFDTMRTYGLFKLLNDVKFADGSVWLQSDAPDYYAKAAGGDKYNYAICGFWGTFDGNGKTIENFRTSGTNHCGFINVLGTGGVIKNVTFKNVYYKMGGYSTGIVAGYANGGTIENVTISGVKLLNNPTLETGRGVGLLVGSVGSYRILQNYNYGKWMTGLNLKNVVMDVVEDSFGTAINKNYFTAIGEGSLGGTSFTGFEDEAWIAARGVNTVFPLICDSVTVKGITALYAVNTKTGYVAYEKIKGINGATENVIAG